MPYVRIDRDIFVDPDDVLPEISTEDLLDEISNRKVEIPNVPGS